MRERLSLLQDVDPEAIANYAGGGRMRAPRDPPTDQEIYLADRRRRREVRLLLKARARCREGNVLRTLEAWLSALSQWRRDFVEKHRTACEAWDAYWQLPPYQRERMHPPARPPRPVYIDADGQRWQIDDDFLALLRDLISRLKKYLMTDESLA